MQGMFKEGYKLIFGLEEVVLKNIEVCQQVLKIVLSLLGLNGMNKMVINYLDKLFVINDVGIILQELEVQYFVVKVLVLVVKVQQEEIGDVVNLVVFFVGEFLGGVEQFIWIGLYFSEIVMGYVKVSFKCLEILEKELVVFGLDIMDVCNFEEVVYWMKFVVVSKQYGQESILCFLIVDVCIQVCLKNLMNFNVDNVCVVKILGGGIYDFQVVWGMVLKSEFVGIIKKVQNVKVVVFGGGVDMVVMEMKGIVFINSGVELENYVKIEEVKVEELIKFIVVLGVIVIVSGGVVGEMVLYFCECYKLMVVKIVFKFELCCFCCIMGVVFLVKLQQLILDELGFVDFVVVEEFGGIRVIVVKNEMGGNLVVMLVICGSMDSLLDDVE